MPTALYFVGLAAMLAVAAWLTKDRGFRLFLGAACLLNLIGAVAASGDTNLAAFWHWESQQPSEPDYHQD